jgi:hypothetical protein
MNGNAPAEPQWTGEIAPWPPDFPRVLTHCGLGELYAAGREPHEPLDDGGKSDTYRRAKEGELDAAIRIVSEIIQPALIDEVLGRLSGAIVASVHAEEAAGRNKLAIAYAMAIKQITGLELEDSIVQINRVNHTDASARQRLARRPEFAGTVERGRSYVVVDDVVTSGSSLAALRHFIGARGGQVVLATTLSAAPARYGFDPEQLAIMPATLQRIQNKFPTPKIDAILKQYGIAPSIHHLTESEGRTVASFDSPDALRSSFVAARQEGGDP